MNRHMFLKGPWNEDPHYNPRFGVGGRRGSGTPVDALWIKDVGVRVTRGFGLQGTSGERFQAQGIEALGLRV